MRQPASVVPDASPSAKVFGAPGAEEEPGTQTTVQGLWMQTVYQTPTSFLSGLDPHVLSLLSSKGPVDAVFRCLLADVLLDPSGSKQGPTLFETALDVLYDGESFEVTGTKRTGLAPEGPYTFWVGLKKL